MKSRHVPALLLALLALAPVARPAGAAAGAEMTRVAYNNPGLLTDLGVGLWAWPLPMDFNGDGLMDLVVVCTDKPSNGIYVFLNTGEVDPVTHLPVFAPGKRTGAADRSPQISYVDGRTYVTTAGKLHPQFKERGFDAPVAIGDPARIHLEKGNIRANQWKYVDFDGDGALDLAVGIDFWGDYGWDDAWDEQGRWKNGPLRGYVYLLRNTGTTGQPVYAEPTKILTTEGKPVDVFGMPSPSFGDFDGDGDLDLICGEFLDGFTYFENVGTRTAPRYAPGRRPLVGGQPLRMDLCMIAPVAVDFDGDGDLDLVVGDEDGRVAFIEHTGKVVGGLPQFLPPRYFRQFAADVKFGALATPFAFDWDGDGDEDLISGNTAGYIGWIENLGGTPVRWAPPRYLSAAGQLIRELAGPNGSIQGPAEAKWGYSILSVADWDGDGLPDLMTNGIWGKVVWYKNVGTRTAPKLAAGQPVALALPPGAKNTGPAWNWWQPKGNELVSQWRTSPHMVDWNGDGLMDLVMSDTEGYLALYERKRGADGKLALLPPQRVFWSEGASVFNSNGLPQNKESGLLRLNDGVFGRGGRRTFCTVDWDGDGKLDLMMNSAPNVNFFRNLGRDAEGRWKFKDEGPVSTHVLAGHATKPTYLASTRELIVGAEDGFFYRVKQK